MFSYPNQPMPCCLTDIVGSTAGKRINVHYKETALHEVWFTKGQSQTEAQIAIITSVGITEHTFKGRLYQHLNSLKYRSKVNSTEMSKHIWNLKDQGITNPCITWSILDHAKTRQNGMKRCNLCTAEKCHIQRQSENILNKRDELISKCRHENKFYLSKFKSVPPIDVLYTT